MIKSLTTLHRRDREKLTIPHSAQEILGIKCVWKDGIMLVGKDLYSKTFSFTDINFAVASDEEKCKLLDLYASILNAMEVAEHSYINLHNRRFKDRDLSRDILLPMM